MRFLEVDRVIPQRHQTFHEVHGKKHRVTALAVLTARAQIARALEEKKGPSGAECGNGSVTITILDMRDAAAAAAHAEPVKNVKNVGCMVRARCAHPGLTRASLANIADPALAHISIMPARREK